MITKVVYSRIIIAALYIMDKPGNNPNTLSTVEWINNGSILTQWNGDGETTTGKNHVDESYKQNIQ